MIKILTCVISPLILALFPLFSQPSEAGMDRHFPPNAIAANKATPIVKTKPKTSVPVSSYLSPLEAQIVVETNKVRANPTSYIPVLEAWKSRFQGSQVYLGHNVFLGTQEGINAINEAIQFLQTTRPVPKLTPSRGMSLAAQDLVRDQGKTGGIGHNSSDGSIVGTRLKRYGVWQKTIAESVSYGSDIAQQIVMQLIIDDGVRDRGHRTNIFSPDWRSMGVACGSHPRYQTVCVINYARGYQEK